MSKKTMKGFFAVFCAFFAFSALFAAAPEKPKVLVATFSGIISPASAEYLGQAIEKGNETKANAIIIQMDTPGGLDPSMREIIKEIMASKVPVVLYVAPAGARAASAGVFIAMASDVVAMSPGTNIGAAHPVVIGDESATAQKNKKEDNKSDNPMADKIINDAAAYMKALTQEKGRNIDWASKAVRDSDSISADEAVKMKIADFVAVNLNDLLDKLDGRKTAKFDKLTTKDAEIIYFDQTNRQRFLAAISNPNVAMILMSAGAAGIFIELYSPGLILPGIVGGISLLTAFYAFHTLSANFTGVALILLGIIFFLVEIKVMSYGMLAIGGVTSVILGTVMLFKSPVNMGLSVSSQALLSSLVGLVAITAFCAWIVLRAQTKKVVTGIESMRGEEGIAKTDLAPKGTVLVAGELWEASSISGNIEKGSPIVIEEVKGYSVKVRKLDNPSN